MANHRLANRLRAGAAALSAVGGVNIRSVVGSGGLLSSAHAANGSGTIAIPGSFLRKWNPGQYGRADAQGYANKDAQHYAVYDIINTMPYCKGAEIPVNWFRTNPSPGVFDFSYIHAHINRITANRTNGKRVLLTTQHQNYGITSMPSVPQSSSGDATVPDFIISSGLAAIRTTEGIMPKLDIPACMDYFLAWLIALAFEFDSDPYVELFTVGETSSAYAGMSSAGYAAQWMRIPAVLQTYWTETWTVLANNGVTSPYTSIDLINEAVARDVGFGVEDAAGFYGSEPAMYGGWGYYAIAGIGVYDEGDGNGPINYGTTDSRLRVPIRAEQQVVRSQSITPTQVNSIMNNHWKNTHSVWVLYFSAAGSSYAPSFYGTGYPGIPAPAYSGSSIVAFLNNSANAVTRTAYPGT